MYAQKTILGPLIRGKIRLVLHKMRIVRPSMLANVNVTLAMSPNQMQSVFNLTLDIHAMVNWQLSKQGNCWPVLHVSRAQVYNLFNWSVLKLSAGRWYCFSVDPRLRSIFFGKNSVCYFLMTKEEFLKKKNRKTFLKRFHDSIAFSLG